MWLQTIVCRVWIFLSLRRISLEQFKFQTQSQKSDLFASVEKKRVLRFELRKRKMDKDRSWAKKPKVKGSTHFPRGGMFHVALLVTDEVVCDDLLTLSLFSAQRAAEASVAWGSNFWHQHRRHQTSTSLQSSVNRILMFSKTRTCKDKLKLYPETLVKVFPGKWSARCFNSVSVVDDWSSDWSGGVSQLVFN